MTDPFAGMRQQERDKLVRLQTQKLEREQQNQYAQSSRRELAGIVAVALALLRFVFKHPIISAIIAGCAYYALSQVSITQTGNNLTRQSSPFIKSWCNKSPADKECGGAEIARSYNVSHSTISPL